MKSIKPFVFLSVGLLPIFFISILLGIYVPFHNADLLLKNAEKGDSKSQRQLGYTYATGERAIHSLGRIKPDRIQAIYWLQKSASQGNGTACFMLAQMYEREATPVSNRLAVHWYTKACTLGEGGSAAKLTAIYQNGLLGQKQDLKMANIWRSRQGYISPLRDSW